MLQPGQGRRGRSALSKSRRHDRAAALDEQCCLLIDIVRGPSGSCSFSVKGIVWCCLVRNVTEARIL